MTTGLVLDLSGFDELAAVDLAARWAEATAAWSIRVCVLVKENGPLAAALRGSPFILVTVKDAAAAGPNWGVAIQALPTERVLLVAGPAEPDLGWHEPGAARAALRSALHPQVDVQALAFSMSQYAQVRGLDTALPTPTMLLDDLAGRIAALDGQVVGYKQVGSPSRRPYVRNLPVWRWRPTGTAPLVTILIVAGEPEPPSDDCLLSAQAQSLDAVDIRVADLTGQSFPQSRVDGRVLPAAVRFGLSGEVRRHDLSGGVVAWRELIESITSKWVMVVGANDLIMPWAASVVFRHLVPDADAVTGVRVEYQPEGDVAGTVNPLVPRALLAATTLLRGWQPRAVRGADEMADDLLRSASKVQESPMAVALRPVAGEPCSGPSWRVPWSADPVAAVQACLPSSFGPRALVLRQLCVGKVDEIEGYDRVHAVVGEFDGAGRLVHESCVVRDADWADFARLSRGGLQFEARLGQPDDATADEIDRAVARRGAATAGNVSFRVAGERLETLSADVRRA